ncbi:MAG: hypothetical protein LBO09_02615 [Candidatus Peribacteria bacterium]|jgi:hypothetical protein|nr:hypothetical protein [Candidatus Peribacteria bacterium]
MVLESLARFCNTTTKNLLEVLIQRNTPPKYEEDKHEEDDKSNPRDYFAFGYKKYRKKVNNKVRELREPIPKLKVIQNTIRDRLLSIPVSLTSMAGKKKDSAEKNAELHRYNPYLITLDIKNAYPSITTHRVYKNLEGSLWNALDIRAPLLTTDEKTTTANNKKLFISALTHLCVSEDELPQGAPTSNQIQNIVMRGFDTKIEKKLPELSCSHLIYSRYADDITLSFLHYTTKDVLEEKFSYYLNKSKKADSETLEVLLQQFEKEKFVATDNFERKYITEKIDEFREIIQHLPLS